MTRANEGVFTFEVGINMERSERVEWTSDVFTIEYFDSENNAIGFSRTFPGEDGYLTTNYYLNETFINDRRINNYEHL